MEQSDIQLIEGYLKGEEESLKVLIGRYLKPIFNFVYRYAGNNRHEAEDITQETFVKIWRNLNKFDSKRNKAGEEKSFKVWIFQIAKNTAFDYLRKKYSFDKKKRILLFSEIETVENKGNFLENIADSSPLPDEIFQRNELVKELNGTIEKLPLKYREILILRYNDHFTFQEISEVMKESINTVKSRHRRGLIQLRVLFEEYIKK